jgi:hypothetical protein
MNNLELVLLQNVASRNVNVKSLNVTVTKRSCTQRRSQNVRVTKRKHHITLSTVTFLRFRCVLTFCDVFLRFVMFAFWNYYVLKLLLLETITFSDATLSDINVLLCYVLSQYQLVYHFRL